MYQKGAVKQTMWAGDQTQYPYHPRDRGRRGKENQPFVGRRQKHSARVEPHRYQQQWATNNQGDGTIGSSSSNGQTVWVPTGEFSSGRQTVAKEPADSVVAHSVSMINTGRIEAVAVQSAEGTSATAASSMVGNHQPQQSQQLDQQLTSGSDTHVAAVTIGDVPIGKRCDQVLEGTETKEETRTHLAKFFDGQRPDAKIDCVLGELVESVLRVSHKESQKHFPTLPRLCAKLRTAERESILHWLIQACDIMGFHEGVLYSTVLTLDRYCALTSEPLKLADVQTVLMAVICTVIKTCAVQDEILESMSLKDLLVHLCRQQVPFNDILVTEHRVLRTLRFQISTPTPLDFLDALSSPFSQVRPQEEGLPPLAPRRVADFIIRLSLFDATLHYRRPHCILAAAALCVAICALDADVGTAANIISPLMEDLVRVCPDVPDAASCVNSCSMDLHMLWREFAAAPTAPNSGLLRMFGDSDVHRATLLHPPATIAVEAILLSRRAARLA